MIVAILFLLSSCENQEEGELSLYFDTEEYIAKEVDQLGSTVDFINQKIVLNGIAETRDSVLAEQHSFQELQTIFMQANINRGIFRNEYDVDTFWILDPQTSANIEVLNYTTANPELRVKWLQVYSNGSLKVSLSEQNFLFGYEKEVYYEKSTKFSVVSWQKSLGLDTIHVFKEEAFL